MANQDEPYVKAHNLSKAIEAELKRLNRWSAPLPDEAFQNMGAFGSNTMAFEQWIQFILLPRLQKIIASQDEFPSSSSLGDHATRIFDGDQHSGQLHQLLYQLDNLVNTITSMKPPPGPPTISVGQRNLPDVVYELVDVLHVFEGDDLESQLQTYDMFLAYCSPEVRPELSTLFLRAAERARNETAQQRIQHAAKNVFRGGRAADQYNDEEST